MIIGQIYFVGYFLFLALVLGIATCLTTPEKVFTKQMAISLIFESPMFYFAYLYLFGA